MGRKKKYDSCQDCGGEHHAKGFCKKCYMKYYQRDNYSKLKEDKERRQLAQLMMAQEIRTHDDPESLTPESILDIAGIEYEEDEENEDENS